MKRISVHILFGVVLLAVLVAGCTKPYKITFELEQPLDQRLNCSVGAIDDELPVDTDPSDKPTVEQIDKFRERLEEELDNIDLFASVGETGKDSSVTAGYHVTGGIVEFKRGSGFVRFLIGFGLGNAYLTVRLALVDNETGATVFEGYFKQAVSSWMESGDKTFERVAQSFAKAVKSEDKKILKRQ